MDQEDFEDALSHENIADINVSMALHCAVSVAKYLKYLNEAKKRLKKSKFRMMMIIMMN